MPAIATRRLTPWAGIALLAALLPGCAARSPDSETPAAPRLRRVSPLFDPGLAPALLDDPQRDRWQQPERLVRDLQLRPGDTVADVGAGSGYLLPHLSRAVGSHGRVLAEEIQAEFLPDLRRKAEALGNVRVIRGTAEDPGLPPGGVDCFVLLTVYHEVERPVDFLRTLRKSARPGARLAVIDFDPTRKPAREGDPPPPAGHAVWSEDVVAEARAAGWRLGARHEYLGSQFFLVFRAPESPPGPRTAARLEAPDEDLVAG